MVVASFSGITPCLASDDIIHVRVEGILDQAIEAVIHSRGYCTAKISESSCIRIERVRIWRWTRAPRRCATCKNLTRLISAPHLMTEHISLTPLHASQLPSSSTDANYEPFVDSLTHASKLFLASLPPTGESTTTWPLLKTHNQPKYPTYTYTSKGDAPPPGVPALEHGLKWHCRVSEHRGVRWEAFRDGLMVDHSLNEQQYISDCTAAERLQAIEPGFLEGTYALVPCQTGRIAELTPISNSLENSL